MTATLICPLDGAVPGDAGTNTTPVNNQINSTTGLDANGNPAHCPICGSAMQVADTTATTGRIAVQTGVAQANQHPVDADFVYVTQADSPLAQVGTAYTSTGTIKTTRISHTVSLHRGTATVTAETLDTVVGP